MSRRGIKLLYIQTQTWIYAWNQTMLKGISIWSNWSIESRAHNGTEKVWSQFTLYISYFLHISFPTSTYQAQNNFHDKFYSCFASNQCPLGLFCSDYRPCKVKDLLRQISNDLNRLKWNKHMRKGASSEKLLWYIKKQPKMLSIFACVKTESQIFVCVNKNKNSGLSMIATYTSKAYMPVTSEV